MIRVASRTDAEDLSCSIAMVGPTDVAVYHKHKEAIGSTRIPILLPTSRPLEDMIGCNRPAELKLWVDAILR